MSDQHPASSLRQPASEDPSPELLHDSGNALVTRRWTADGGSVVCKEPRGGDAGHRLRQERGLLRRLARVEGVTRLAEAAAPDGCLLLRDTGGTSLDRVLRSGSLPVTDLLSLGVRLARILVAVHQAGVAHGNVTPSNVLVLRDQGRVQLIDFSRATTVAEHRPGFGHHTDLAGSLAYLAPEQTGRTGRSVDQRADLYGLGATLFQAATGQLPFADADPLQLLHDVLTRVPVALADLVPEIPRGFSDLVARLLAKEPDRRYQSADGVLHDLSRIHDEFHDGRSEPFPLAEHDFPLRLAAPSQLVGREAEIGSLERALTDSLTGRCRGVLVSGAPGVGKTALVDELRPMVTARGGWFVSGKFDQYRRERASEVLTLVLGALGRLLLAEPEDVLRADRARLLAELGANAGLVAALQPEFGLVLGVSPELDTGDSASTQSRLVLAGTAVLRAIASPERPVVLLLDDLQWAAPLPISMIDSVLQDDTVRGVLVVGAYRDCEVDLTHPLSPMLDRWEGLQPAPLVLRPENLPSADLAVMLAEMLRLQPEPARLLAAEVGARSGGNPFDTVELVNALRDDEILVRDVDGWRWDVTEIRRHVGAGDVVDLLAARISRLPLATATLLERMACLGGEVRLGLLPDASGLTPGAVEERLLPALEDGLLVLEHGTVDESSTVVRFRHDRVQQAAFSRLTPSLLDDLRLDLARNLTRDQEHRDQERRVLAADQYLPVVGRLTDPEERGRVARLFQEAAGFRRLTDPATAERSLAAARSLLEGGTDPDAESLRVWLETVHHEVLCSLGRLEDADEVYRTLCGHCTEALDLAEATSAQISSLTRRDQPVAAVELGLDLLTRLGTRVPQGEEIPVEVDRGMERFRLWAEENSLAEDLRRPEASDPVAIATARIINRLIPPSFFAAMPIMPWLVFECQRLWAVHGPCAALIGPLAHAGFVSAMIGEAYRTGYTALRRVLTVSESRGYEPDTSQARLLLTLSSGQWFEPVPDLVVQTQRAYEGLVSGGDLQNADLSLYAMIPSSLECTPSLATYLDTIDAGLAFAERTGDDHVRTALVGYRQLARALSGSTDAIGSFSDASFDTDAHLAAVADLPVASSYTHITLALRATLFPDADALSRQLEHTHVAMRLLPVYTATLSSLVIRFLRALALAGQLRAGTAPDRAEALAELETLREWIAGRAADAPQNFSCMLHLVDAELAWAGLDHQRAVQAFEAAVADAASRPGSWHTALVHERAALFHLGHGLDRSARQLLGEARRIYREWGAAGKVAQLEQDHPELLAVGLVQDDPAPTSSVSAESIDLLAVLRTSQALSSETSLSRLQERVVEVLGAMTGATSVRVVLRRDDPEGWYLSTAEDRYLSVTDAAEQGLVPLSPFHYVGRTREPLLVTDATRDPRFEHDPVVRTRERCSLLVLPVLSHGVVRAVLVLENDLSSGAFSPGRLDAVQLLAGQLAVSLENAMVYEELELRVRERTRELRRTQNELVDTARRVGMAEIATNVLHNVGNVLNSVNVSAGLMMNRMRASKLEGLSRAVTLLAEHDEDLGGFLTEDERGRLLPGYLSRLVGALSVEHQDVVSELAQLTRCIDHIKDIVATQQTYAGDTSLVLPTVVSHLVDDALRMNTEGLTARGVTVVRELADLPPLCLDQARVILVLVNLIANARDALEDTPAGDRRLTVRTGYRAGMLRVEVADTGVGIPAENLTRVFGHGFTTRPGGHGFGLHSCALAATEMGGALTVHSDGPGQGAVFVLELPAEAGRDELPAEVSGDPS